MFRLAVLGPIFTSGFGAARQCLACYRARAATSEAPCFGFGAGCLGYQPARSDAQPRVAERKPVKDGR